MLEVYFHYETGEYVVYGGFSELSSLGFIMSIIVNLSAL